jgi:hypothetical protein
VPSPGAVTPANPAVALSPVDEFVWHAETVQLLVLSAAGAVLRWNQAVVRRLGAHAVLEEGVPVWGLLARESASLLRTAMEEARTGPIRRLLTFTDGERFAFTLSCSVHRVGETFLLFGEQRIEQERRMNEELLALTDELALVSRERARVAAELEKALADLRASHWLIQKIHEHLPVCVLCHKVATGPRDEARWESLAAFLAENGLFMTHGYGPGCEAAALAALEQAVLPGLQPPPP